MADYSDYLLVPWDDALVLDLPTPLNLDASYVLAPWDDALALGTPDNFATLADLISPIVWITPEPGRLEELIEVRAIDERGVSIVFITAEHGGRVDTVYDGAAFGAAYAESETSGTSADKRFVLRGAWAGTTLTVRVAVVDVGGNVTRAESAYQLAAPVVVPPPPDVDVGDKSLVVRTIEALMMEPARIMTEARALCRAVSPRRARRDEDLDDWEAALDIVPDGVDPAERAARVAARIRTQRDHTLAAYEQAAADRSFAIMGVRPPPAQFRAGLSAAGDPVRGDAWAYLFIFDVEGGGDVEPLEADFIELSRAHAVVRVVGHVT